MVDQANLTIDEICVNHEAPPDETPGNGAGGGRYLGLIKTRSTGRHDLAVGEISKGLKKPGKIRWFPC